MRNRLGLAVAITGAALVLAAVLAAVTMAVLSSAAPADRDVIERVLREQAVLVFWSWVLATVLCALVIARIWDRYVTLPERLAAATSIIATANPSHRLTEEGPAPLRHLAASVNQLAEAYQREQSGVAVRIAEANADLDQERTRLAVLMSELTVAVLVCNAEGRILLYNSAARQVLDRAEDGSHTLVGLGRSVFAILDRNLIAYALERIDSGQAGAQPVAAVHRDRLLRAHIAPVTASARPAGDAAAGFVVTLEDMTHRAETARTRDELLGSLTQGTRAAVAAIRAAVENVLDYPQMDPGQRVRFLEIVREEASGLGRRLDASLSATAAALDDTWLITDLQARDLLDTLARGLERDGQTVDVQEPAEALWVHVDGFALQRVVASLAERLRTELGVSAFGLRVGWTGRLASVDLTWSGPALATATLQEWVSQPPTQGGADQASSPQEVIARHGGEIWCGADDGAGTPGGVAYLRVLLPLAEHTPSAPAPRPLRVAEAEPQRDGLASYDFSLLAPSNTPGPWQDRALSDLSFTVFDTETTGLFPRQGDEIISIGAVRIVNGRLLRQETFDQLVDPQRSVPDASVQIHGIRPEVLVGQPTIDLVLPGFAAFAEDTVLVGHNVAFDLQFLRPRRAVAGALLTQPVLDTLLLSAVVHPEQDSHTLEAMADRLGVNVIGRHSALGDALVTGEVFLKLLGLMIERGIHTLGEAQEAAQQTYQARKSDSLYTKG